MTPDLRTTQVLRQIEALLRAGNLPQAMLVARDAADGGVAHSSVLVLAAHKELELGQAGKALAHAARAREQAPRSPDALHAEGMALAALGRHKEAVALFDQTLRQAPRLAQAHFHKALSLSALHELVRAEREFERTAEIDPAHAGALARLASLAAARGEVAKARSLAERALRANPREVAAEIALAQLDLEAHRYDAARARLVPLLPRLSPVNASIAQGLIADAFDGAGRHAEAFRHYAESNRILRALYVPEAERAIDRAQRLLRDLPEPANETASGPVATHVFLIGFPRSGTTLLEQVLAAHPDIETLEERDCLVEAMADFILPPDGLQRLAAAQDLTHYRDAYWTQARAGGMRLDKRVFVDKLPLNALNLALIARLFPSAGILLALRDPRDVVLSCFRRRFEMSANMYELLDLGDAARFYAAVMALCEAGRARLGLEFHDCRYEDLVADLPARAQALCDFLDVAYDDAMLGFAGKAKARGINTPSAAQVARGLYSTGMGQWRAYEDQLAPVLPVLAPFIARYGYEES